MRGRTVLILLILVAGLVAFIELYEHELPSSEERAALDKLVLDIESRDVTAVQLEWDGRRVALERELSEAGTIRDGEDLAGSKWQLVGSVAAAADVSLVTSLVDSLATLEKKRVVQESSREAMGLSPPRLVATLTTVDRRTKLEVGSDVPAGGSMIVAVDMGEIVVVDNSLWTELTRKPGDWRSRQALSLEPDLIDKVVLTQTGRQIVLAKRGADFWLEEPFVDLADAERVGGLLADLASMRIDSFADELPESATDRRLDPAAAELEIAAGESGDVVHVAWGGPVPNVESQYYARVGQHFFSTRTDLQQYFDLPVTDWRSFELTSFETFQIDVVEVRQQDTETISLGRDGANWSRNEDEISFTVVSDLLYAVTEARAATVAAGSSDKMPELDSSESILELLLKGGEREQIIRFSSAGEDGARAWVSDRGVVLFVGKDEFTEILDKVRQVRAASSVKEPVDEQLLSDGSTLSPDQ